MRKAIKIKKIQKLVSKYLVIRNKLQKELNFLGGDIIENYGIFIAKQYIPKLKINKYSNIKGFDAKDGMDKKVEIKTVTRKDNKYGVVFKSWRNKNEFDYAILISLDKNFKPNFILKVSSKLVKRFFSKKSDSLTISNKLVRNSPKKDLKFLEISEKIDLYPIWQKMINN